MSFRLIAIVLVAVSALAGAVFTAAGQSSSDIDVSRQCQREDNRVGQIISVEMMTAGGEAWIVRGRGNVRFRPISGCALLNRDRLLVRSARVRFNRCGEVHLLEGTGRNSERLNIRCTGRPPQDVGQPAGVLASIDGVTVNFETPVRVGAEAQELVAERWLNIVSAYNADIRQLNATLVGETTLADLCNGDVDIVTTTQPISYREAARCTERDVAYVEAPIAVDAAVIIVNPANPLTSITQETARLLWSDAPSDAARPGWRAFSPGFVDAPIEFVVGDPAGIGVVLVRERITGSAPLRSDLRVLPGDEAVISTVARTPNAVGVVAYSAYVRHAGAVRALAIDAGAGAIAASDRNVSEGLYPLARPLLWYINVASLDHTRIRGFVAYSFSNGRYFAGQAGQTALSSDVYQALAQQAVERQPLRVYSTGAPEGASISELVERARSQEPR
ncbi:MAG: hypothetical protein DCF16_05290 [Alphaproteobacteria bacterium]|nr:MAG: hypothetical protein DCF16_05290 [Alphaproteobacteria bacterium]